MARIDMYVMVLEMKGNRYGGGLSGYEGRVLPSCIQMMNDYERTSL